MVEILCQLKQVMTRLQLKLMWVIVMIIWGICMSQPCFSVSRDPTRPVAYQEGAVVLTRVKRTDLIVSAIFHSEDRKFATVDGRYVKAGDKIGNVQVLAISHDAVTFEDDSGKFTIPVHAYVVKQEVKAKGKTE